jgi:hypothetical protein
MDVFGVGSVYLLASVGTQYVSFEPTTTQALLTVLCGCSGYPLKGGITTTTQLVVNHFSTTSQPQPQLTP